jgi:hypothetical protein
MILKNVYTLLTITHNHYAANAVSKDLAVSLNHIYTHEPKSFNIVSWIELLVILLFYSCFIVLFLIILSLAFGCWAVKIQLLLL